jgi:hypothetical protein
MREYPEAPPCVPTAHFANLSHVSFVSVASLVSRQSDPGRCFKLKCIGILPVAEEQTPARVTVYGTVTP